VAIVLARLGGSDGAAEKPREPAVATPATPTTPVEAARERKKPSIRGHVKTLSIALMPDCPSIAFAPTKGPPRLLARCPDGFAAIWDLDTARPVVRFEAREPEIGYRSAAFSPSGKLVAIGFAGPAKAPTVQVFDATSGARLATFVGHGEPTPVDDSSPASPPGTVYGVSFLDDERLLSSGRDCTVRLWDVAQKKPIGVFVDPADLMKRSHGLDANAVVPWRDHQVVSASDDGTLHVWKVDGLELVRPVRPPPPPPPPGQGYDPGRTKVCCQTIAFLPDGESALVGTNDGDLYHWKIGTDQCDRWVRQHDEKRIESLVVLPGGEHVISGCRDGTIRLWQVSDGRCLEKQTFPEGAVASVALAPDGRTLAVSITLGQRRGGKIVWLSLEPTR
jgi:hypothetical protein